MPFAIRCPCGREIPVQAGQAGTQVHCACGQWSVVPSLGELKRHAEAGTVAPAMDLSAGDGMPEDPQTPQPPCQVTLLTPVTALRERINQDALHHFLQAAMHEAEDFFANLPQGRGMDFRLALALLPDGARLVDVAVRPDCLGQTLATLRRRLLELPAPPVRRGPVAILAHTLIWGGSDNLEDSFRHRLGPYYRSDDRPEGFDAALQRAELSSTIDDVPGMDRGHKSWWKRAQGMARKLLAGARRLLSPEVFPARPPQASQSPGDLADALYAQLPRCGADWVIQGLTGLIEKHPQEASLYGRRGDLYQEQGQFEQAIADYTEMISRDPRNARAFLVRGTCHRLNGSMEKALADFNEALWLQPVCADALAERSRIYVELQALEHAMADVTTAMELEPNHPRWPMLRGRILAMQDKLDQAIDDFSLAVRLDPHNDEAFFLRGHAYRDRRGRGEQAETDNREVIDNFSEVIRKNAGFAWGYAYRAEARLLDNDVTGAMADCEEALRRDAECALAYAIRGAANQQQGEHRAAIDDCTEAIRLGADGPPLRVARAEAYGAEAEWESALEDCNAALEAAPEHAGARALRARVYVQMGSFDEAFEDVEEAIRLAPKWHVSYTIRGNLHGLQGEHGLAVDDFDEALRLEPDDHVARQNRGVAWCHQEEFDKAIEDFNECIERGACEPPVYFGRANAWLQKGEQQKARADLDETLRRDPDFAPAWFSRANLLVQLGEHDAARSDFDELIRRCPTLAIAYAGRANLWLQMGETEKAEEDFREAVRLDPGGAEGYTLQRLIVEAGFHYRKEDYPRTIALANEVIELDPECLPAYSLRAAAWWCSEHQVEAVDDYTRMLELGGESFAPFCNRGQVYAEMGEFDQALEDLNHALEIGKKESAATLVHVRSGRALAYAGLGRHDEANRDFDQCLRDGPKNAWVHYYRGLVYHGRGDTASAAASFRLALESEDPSLPPRKRDRARAYLRRLGQKESVPSGS